MAKFKGKKKNHIEETNLVSTRVGVQANIAKGRPGSNETRNLWKSDSYTLRAM